MVETEIVLKIVNCISLFTPFGGAQRVCLDHIKVQGDLGYQSVLLTSELVNNYNSRKFKSLKNPLFLIIEWKKLTNELRGADYIFTHSTVAGFVIRLLACIVGLRNIYHTYHGFDIMRSRLSGLYKISELLIGRYSAAIFLSEREKYFYNESIRKTKDSFVIPNSSSLNPVKSHKVLQKSTVTCVFIARHSAQKNHESFIREFHNVSDLVSRVIFLGGGELIEYHKSLAQQYGVINKFEFIGHVDDVTPFLEVADISILISKAEGLPVGLIESIGYALPIVASNVGSVDEICIHGKNGFLLNNNDGNDLRDAILNVIGNYENYSKESIELFQKTFSWNRFKQNVIRVINE